MTTMDDARRTALIDALNLDLQRKSNDLFRYAINSSPYVPRGDEFFLEAYKRLIPIEDDNAQSLTAAIEMLDGTPSPGVWDLGIADLNYLNVRHLNRELTELVEETLAQLESHLPLAEGFPKIEAILQTVIEDTRDTLEQLREWQNRPNEVTLPALKTAPAEAEATGASDGEGEKSD